MAEKYRTKEDYHAIDARQLTSENAHFLTAWCAGVFVTEHDALQHDVTYAAINVPTAEGMKRAQEGDWIVRYIVGYFDTFKAADFERLFEEVVDG